MISGLRSLRGKEYYIINSHLSTFSVEPMCAETGNNQMSSGYPVLCYRARVLSWVTIPRLAWIELNSSSRKFASVNVNFDFESLRHRLHAEHV